MTTNTRTETSPTPAKRRKTERSLPSHQEIAELWFSPNSKQYNGPGRKALQRCSKCHRWNYESRYSKAVLRVTRPVAHQCEDSCTDFNTCPTSWKEGHPEVVTEEKRDKLRHHLSNKDVENWKKYRVVLEAQRESEIKENGKSDTPQPAEFLTKQLEGVRRFVAENHPQQALNNTKWGKKIKGKKVRLFFLTGSNKM